MWVHSNFYVYHTSVYDKFYQLQLEILRYIFEILQRKQKID